MRTRTFLAVLALSIPAALRAQAVVDPGMSAAQVIARLGTPAMQKTTGGSTYLFYKNGSERRVGMADIVVLEGDKVVDAVFRSTARRYSGTSSSPAAIPPEVARKHPQESPSGDMKISRPAAPAANPGTKAGAKESQRMPAQQANESKKVTATPQARSAMLEQQKAAAATKAADSARAAKAADSAKSAKAAPPPKKP